MIIQTQLLFVLLTTVAFTDGRRRPTDGRWRGSLLRTSVTVSPTTVSTFNKQDRYPNWSRRIRTTSTLPSTTTEEILTTINPPIQSSVSSFFTTDSLNSKTLTMPRNESTSRLLFWPPSENISITLNVTLINQHDFTFPLGTVLPQQWHTIDLNRKNKLHNFTHVSIYAERRSANLEDFPILQIQVSSEETIYWCYCPQSNLCTLLSPLQYASDSSTGRIDLLVPLIVVVVLLIVTISALIGVTFYRKSELFHIYAKPIDCLPYAVPPPLPTANQHPSPRQIKNEKNEREHKAEKIEENTYENENQKVNTNNLIIPGYTKHTKEQEQDTMNTLYGLV